VTRANAPQATPDRRVAHDASLCATAWQALRRAHEQVSSRLAAELDRCCDLTISDFDVLLYVYAYREAQVRLQDLVEAGMLSQPAMSRLVARLESRGLVERRPAPDDGRVSLIRLTRKGMRIAEEAMAVHAETIDAVLSRQLTRNQQRDLVEILGKTIARSERER
jgi:DNA-binding MarR family transcriptional regulator